MTVSSALATAYSNQKKAYTFSNGDTIEVIQDTGTNAKFLRRTSAGVVTDFGADIAGWSNGSIGAVTIASTEYLVAGWFQSGTGGSRTDAHLYLMVGTFNSGRTTLTWGTVSDLGAQGAGTFQYLDLVAFPEGSGGQVAMVAGYNSTLPNNYVAYLRAPLNSSGVIGTLSRDGLSTFGIGTWGILGGDYGINVGTFPSLDYDPATKRLFAAWSAGTTGAGKGIRFRTAAYSAGAWTWATEVEVDNTVYIGSSYRWLKCVWDDVRSKVVIGGLINTSAPADHMMAWDSANFTSFVNRVDTTDTSLMIPNGSLAVDTASGDIYFVGQDYSNSNQQYVLATRVGTSFNLGRAVQIDGFISGANLYTYAWLSGGKIRLLYVRGNNSPYQVVYYEFAPPTYTTQSFGMYVGSFTKQSAAGFQDIALPAGCPDLTNARPGTWAIQFWTAGSDLASGAWRSDIYGSLGFTTGSYGSYAVGAFSESAQATSNTSRRMAAKCITSPDAAGTGARHEADFDSFPTASTVRLNWTTNGAVASVIMFTIYTGLTSAKVVNWTTPTAAGAKAVTGAGFQPDLVLHAASLLAGALPQVGTGGGLGFGAMNKHGQQWANSIWSNDNVSPSNASRWQQTDACIASVYANDVALTQAHFVSMNADGFTTYFPTVDTTANNVASLCLGGVSSQLGSFVSKTGTGTQIIPSRHGLSARGALFSTFGQIPSSAPTTDAEWMLGAYDGTNSRAAILEDADAAATTVAKSMWSNAASLMDGSSAGVTRALATVSSWATDSFTVDFTSNTGGIEYLYLLVGDSGTDTFPRLAATWTVTNPPATAYSNQKKEATLSTGREVVVIATTGTNAEFWWSDDGFATKTQYTAGTSDIAGWSNGSIDSYVDTPGAVERLVAVWKQSGTGGGRTDTHIYMMVGTFNAARTTLAWGTAVSFGAGSVGGPDTGAKFPDLVVHPEGTGGIAHWVASNNTANPDNYVWYGAQSISASGVLSTLTAMANIATPQGVNTPNYPSIDIDPVTERLFVVWSAGVAGAGKGIRFRTASYSAGAWTWATEVEVLNTHYIDAPDTSWLCCRWDATGSRVILAGRGYTGSGYGSRVIDSTNFTTFTVYSPSVGILRGAIAIEPASGDVFFVGDKGADVGYVRWRRATGVADSYVVTDAGAITSPYAYAWYSTGKINWIYTAGNNSPYAIKYDRLVLSNTWSQSLTAALTSAGVYALKGRTLRAGSLAPAAAAVKKAGSQRSGAVTSSGVGNLKALAARSGAISLSGGMSRFTRTPKSAALTPLGDSVKKFPFARDGELSGSGGLLSKPQKALAAALGSASALARRVLHMTGGEVFFSPDETNFVRVYIYSTVDTVGSLVKKSTRFLVAVAGSAGSIVRVARLPRGASVSSSSGILRRIKKVEVGSANPASTATRKVAVLKVGAMSPSASQTRKTGRSRFAELRIASSVRKYTRRAFGGAFTSQGMATKKIPQLLAAALTAGADSRSKTLKRLTGALASSSSISKLLGLGREWAQTQPDLENEPFGGTGGSVAAVDRSYTAPDPGQIQGQTRSRWG